jgi:hypothetical protein
VGCEIADNQSTSEHTVDDIDSKGKKTIYLHLKKFFHGTRFTFQPFLKSLEEKHKEGEIVCVSGKVSFLELLTFFFLISNFKFINKAQRDATLIHGKYTRAPLKGRNM